ncbi:aspartate/ornithine carbamoyltransferase family protein [Alsobacter sp. R-9]
MVQIKSAFPARIARVGFVASGGHLISTSTLTPDDVDALCELASDFATGRANATRNAGHTIALLFFQASTRTRLGFEVATFSLGCQAIGMDDMGMSRSNDRTGESLEDCAAVVSRLCDAIVVRHHASGSAARMAAKSRKPVINAGDGWNEHPTQALIDIFAMRKGLRSLRGRSLAFGGDPRGRTVRSLVQLLRHEMPSEIVFCPPAHVPVPEDVVAAVAEHQIRLRVIHDLDDALRNSDAIMMTPYDMSDIGEAPGTDYKSPRVTPASHRVTAERIARTNSKAFLYHPLPRQDEIDPDCDDLPNAMYFEQVRLSKFMRMAVLDRALATD